jgi:hypothetical protein
MTILTKGMGGAKILIKKLTDMSGRKRIVKGGELEDFTYKPKMPLNTGQGKLFTEKFKKESKGPKLFPAKRDAAKTLKTLTKKAEIK